MFQQRKCFSMINGANAYFIAFNRYLIRKNTTNYSKSQQTTEAEAGHFLYFDCKQELCDSIRTVINKILIRVILFAGS